MIGATTIGSVLLAAAVMAPLAALALCLPRATRWAVPMLLPVAPLPGLAAAVLALHEPALAFEWPALRLSLRLDAPAAMLLCAAALLWSAAGVWAIAFLRRTQSGLRFVACWLLTMVGSMGVFAVADLTGFYLFFALVSLPAYGLITHDEESSSYRAGAVYIAFAVLGEALLLIGFALLAAGEPTGSLQIRDVMAAVPGSPWRSPAIALTCAGFVFKMGLIPVHAWMPLSYTAAPIPAAAVLSGAAVKAGVIGLVRFLPFDDPFASDILVTLGLLSAFYGVAVGLTQSNPRTVLAYSSVSQMGVIATLLGMGLAAADPGVRLDAAFYAANHTLAKGVLFLAIGMMATGSSDQGRTTIIVAAVLALGLGGLPLTGGALAKLVAKSSLGQGVVGWLALASTVGTSLLMMHFLSRLAGIARQDDGGGRPAACGWSWRAAAAAAILLPWLLFGALGESAAAALAPSALLASTWPVVTGAVLWLAIARWGDRLPTIPPGDFLGGLERLFRATYSIGAALTWIDIRLRTWSAAVLSLLAIAIVLAAATMPRG